MILKRFKIYINIARDTEDVKRALIYLKNAVDQGHPEAQYTLGRMFLGGIGFVGRVVGSVVVCADSVIGLVGLVGPGSLG